MKNRLKFMIDIPSFKQHPRALYRCTCGNTIEADKGHVKANRTRSCGCLIREGNHRTHGLTHHPLFTRWQHIIERCCNENNKLYKYYGARKIDICKEWRNNFKKFYDWCMENGYKHELQIDRIDNNKGYYPENCRFVTAKINSRNSRKNRFITFNGETKCLSEWAEYISIESSTLWARLNRGWSIKKSLTTELL